MNQLDVFYRAWLEYRAVTTKNRDCSSQRRNISRTDTESETLTVIRNVCDVDEDWICEIEKGLVYIEKAIKEERQFIYSNGEVLPIEKVKHISKDSVQHLAKHSNLITREQEGDDIIPDKLYSVERLNDYTVYENRFLYMLLCYLRDFVTIRYDKILEFSNKYDGSLTLNKTVVTPSQKISYSIELHEERNNDKYLRDHNEAKDIIDRMDLILKSVIALLATPLMEEQAKVAMLKPPITKTNVLKMDNNFKAAVALYEYVVSYDKEGYTVEPRNTDISPFGDDIGDEIADVCSLISFLTYEHGLDIEGVLKSEYELEQIRRKEQEIAQKAEQLKALRRKLDNSEMSSEEYILALEKQIKLINSHMTSVDSLCRDIAELKASEKMLKETVEQREQDIVALNEEMAARELKYFEDIERLKSEHIQQINEMSARHEQEKLELTQKHEEEKQELIAKNNERIAAMQSRMDAQKEMANEQISAIQAKLNESEAQNEALGAEKKELADNNLSLEARIKALRIEQGLVASDEDYTDKQGFDELEKQLEAFVAFYESQWGEAKKKIRKKLLSYDKLKGEKKRKG
ncbi:MAG: hypothetical protein E7653_03690 [Ruminococcaceae bacterium]|nr:hypothetical protein [Oscillospiraceae bacterium]